MSHVPPLSDEDYLALCVWDEARGEPTEGKFAVAEVVLNRARLRCHSDGTIRGTVLAKDQFSGFYFDMVAGRYQRVCYDTAAADHRAHSLLLRAKADARNWSDCRIQAKRAIEEHHASSPDSQVGSDAVLFYNPAVVHAPPSWATADKYVTTIGHHAFYRG